ncbi:hypothetical protein [Nocardioides aequoreus]|uniref:hypothetical protein n=1 Tax=Nocardioides aequoreus TaxID=397278 RepID=UPI000AEFE2C6|nr:hypothetical protein [Nocardioides aequoreus]
MPSSPRRRVTWRALAPLSTLLLLGSLVACGSDDEPDAAPSPSASESADETPTPSPSETPTESASASPSASDTPTTSPTPSESAPSKPATLRDALLPASELPGLNEESSWTAAGTGPVGTRPFGWCAQFDALTIGARDGVQRQLRSGDDRAAQQVLDFVDETNAVRAERVFRSWHQDCRRGDVTVRPVQQVDAGGATAWWYLSSTGRAGGQWESFGLARSGNRVTLLRMQHAGQDHSYPRGQDPLELGLQAAASRLG